MMLVHDAPYRERCSPQLRDGFGPRQVAALRDRIAEVEQDNRELRDTIIRLRTVADDARVLATQPCGRCGS